MELEVQQFVSQQMVYDQVCASFNAPPPPHIYSLY
jgi:hypothetical protein